MNWKKLKSNFDVWSLHYRQEIVWFIVGFVIGAILLQMKPIIITLMFLAQGEIKMQSFEIFETCSSWFHTNVAVTERKKKMFSDLYYHSYEGKKVVGYICNGKEPQ